MQLNPKNSLLNLPGETGLDILRELELAVVSLHKIGAYYAVCDEQEKPNYAAETTRFIDEWKITSRLAHARALLTQLFDPSLGADEMDDIERAMSGLNYWSSPRSTQERA